MKKGMTLIEILVTALILSIGITSMMYSFVTCKQINIRNSHRNNAVQIINRYFEDIQRQESELALFDYLNNNSSTNLNLNTGVSVYKKATFANSGQRYFLTIRSIGTINPTPVTNLSLLEATISWSEDTAHPDPYNTITMRVISNEPNM